MYATSGIIEQKERLRKGILEIDFKGGKEKSRKLSEVYNALALKYQIEFLDLSDKIRVSEVDGVHLDQSEHENIASLLSERVKKLFEHV